MDPVAETTNPTYRVKTPVYEGPFDLLLNLIESRKLFINEISLSEVTNDYVAYTRQISDGKISETTAFIVIAATLILIKSKSLLPNMTLTDDEKNQIGNLENRLALYKLIQDIGPYIKSEFGANAIYPRPEKEVLFPVFTPGQEISKDSMYAAVSEILKNLPKKESLPEVSVKKVVSIEEMIDSLASRIQDSLKMSFRDFSKSSSGDTKEQKVTVIVSFLAVLELVRQGIMEVVQNAEFDDIEMMKLEHIDQKEEVGESDE